MNPIILSSSNASFYDPTQREKKQWWTQEWGSLSLVGCELPTLHQGCKGRRRHPHWGKSATVTGTLSSPCPTTVWVNDQPRTDTGVIVTKRDRPLGFLEVNRIVGRDHNTTNTEPQMGSSNNSSATYYPGGFGHSLHLSEPQLFFCKMG